MNRQQEIIEASTKLVRKLEAIHEDPKYQAVWQMYAIHGMTYSGPKYDKELIALKELLGDFDYK
jgi:hypothetical protein